MFQLTAARRRLAISDAEIYGWLKFQLTAARRRLDVAEIQAINREMVSTHSRPKAAGLAACLDDFGCLFQLTAARRRLAFACLSALPT